MSSLMNKETYLSRLRTHLSRISEGERQDILRDQEELIRDAISSGRDEKEFIASLGDPKVLASSLIAESRLQKYESSSSVNGALKSSIPALLALLTLAPFNIIFVAGPFFAMLIVLTVFWALLISGVGASILAVFFYFTELTQLSVDLSIHLATGFFFLGILAFFVFLSVCMAYITKFIFMLSIKYLRWNLKLIKPRNSEEV